MSIRSTSKNRRSFIVHVYFDHTNNGFRYLGATTTLPSEGKFRTAPRDLVKRMREPDLDTFSKIQNNWKGADFSNHEISMVLMSEKALFSEVFSNALVELSNLIKLYKVQFN